VVTGAGSGIGRALCLVLLARGLRVIGLGRRREALEGTRTLSLAAAGAVDDSPPAMDIQVADIAKPEDRAAAAEGIRAVLAQNGASLTCLVHNAAILGEVGPPSALSEEGFREAMAINVEGPLFLTQALAGDLGASGGGRVLHVSSGAAHSALRGWLPYCTTKAALLHLMRCLDKELAEEGVRVGSAMPGVVDTDMQASIRGLDFPDVGYFRSLQRAPHGDIQASLAARPAPPPGGALDRPENVAQFLAWLLLDVQADEFGGREWDIHDQASQQRWLSAVAAARG